MLLVLSCDMHMHIMYMYMCRCTHVHVHNSTCTGKSACAQGNYLRIWSLDRKMSSRISEKKCPTCSFNASTVKLVLSHLRSVHSSDPRFHVMCGIDGCARTYRKYSGLHSHLYRCHWSSSRRISQNLGDTSNTATGVDCMEINQPCNCEQPTMDIIPGMYLAIFFNNNDTCTRLHAHLLIGQQVLCL